MEQKDDTSIFIEAELIRIPANDAASICVAAGLDAEANALLLAEDTPRTFLERLLQRDRDEDALAFLAYALPKREVIWWACVVFRHQLEGHANRQDERALQIAEAWVYGPDQELCDAAGHVAEDNAYRTPTALIAASVYWAGDSLAPPDCPKVPPGQDLTHKGVLSAITLTLIAMPNDANRDHFKGRLLSTGIKIAQGATSKTILLGGISDGSSSIENTG